MTDRTLMPRNRRRDLSHGHERIVRAALRDAPAIEATIWSASRVQAMRQRDRRPFSSAMLALQVALVLRVDVGGGLVEDDDGRVLQDSARDGEALALAAAQRGAILRRVA